jgi:hypothetical protein
MAGTSAAFLVTSINSEEILMSTLAISSTSSNSQQYLQTRQSDLRQLGEALRSGDLGAAKTAFNTILKLGQNGPFAGGQAFSLSHRQQDFNAIGRALQSGNLGEAQQAFGALKETFDHAVINPHPSNASSPTSPSASIDNSGGSSPAEGLSVSA